MGEAAGVRDLARGVRRAGVPSSAAGVERPAGLVGAVRGVVERRAEAAAWSGVAGAPSVAVVVAVASSMVLATSAAGAGTAVRGVGCDTASCSVASVRSFFNAGAGESSPCGSSVATLPARGGSGCCCCCGSSSVAARTTGVGARGSLFVAAAVGVAASMQGGSVARAGVATAALQGDCAGVVIGVVEDMAVGSAERLRSEIPKAQNNSHYARHDEQRPHGGKRAPEEIKAEHQRVKGQWLCCVEATRNEWWSLC
jgi:hypothetical protein